MLDIEVRKPVRTETRYEHHCIVRPGRSPRPRLLRLSSGGAGERPTELRFGFRALNFAIRHHEVWDGLYPLFYLTRNGGPLFGTPHDLARIRFAYPISAAVRDFYVQRAADFGFEIVVEAPTLEARLDEPTAGHVLAFGGGKDSRLVLGLLRELGRDPLVITAGAANAHDLPDALVVEPLTDALADRVMPSLMALGRHFSYGSGLGEVHLETPWQQYYDMGSPRSLAQLSALMASLGIETHAHAPAAGLPYNLTQRILHDRYPDLHAGQVSVRRGMGSEKNLHVSLLKLMHGISFEDHCDEPLFRKILARFVGRQTDEPLAFGYRNHRETINREMRAIIWRHRDHPLMSGVRERVPPDWDGPWIDYVHTYAWPSPDPAWLAIYAQHAPMVDEAAPGIAIRRVRV